MYKNASASQYKILYITPWSNVHPILHHTGTVCGEFLDLGSLDLQDPKYLVYFSFLTKEKYLNYIISK